MNLMKWTFSTSSKLKMTGWQVDMGNFGRKVTKDVMKYLIITKFVDTWNKPREETKCKQSKIFHGTKT